MYFSINESASKAGITHALFLVVRGLVCSPSKSEFVSHCNEIVATEMVGDLQRFNEGFRQVIYNTTGRDNFSTAGENLRDNFKERGFRSINNIVDAYNEAAFFYGIGIGGHDICNVDLSSKIEVTLATDNDFITPLFQKKEKKIVSGELIYKAGDKNMAWIGSKDVDSDDFKISPKSTDCIFVILGHEHVKPVELYTVSLRIRRNIIASSYDFNPDKLDVKEYYYSTRK
ncbi:phenylalanine--tRNA ligase beta subunit-related protein [Rahnella sikkimica]|uniref:B3/B4 tRNA-binding domain-containing protein n=1 Tax=Rahnella sikkimica TaxID=1805933 RepID=A0A2L1UZJ0_9GAMM|nr:phenylalanine--tRNA ligase beta subunit-related protein [Rahnella sikkimica]AVF38258.1 hypothetical protein BV494_25620 [Rahnella sikkimica]